MATSSSAITATSMLSARTPAALHSGNQGPGLIAVLVLHGMVFWLVLNGVGRPIIERVKLPEIIAHIVPPPELPSKPKQPAPRQSSTPATPTIKPAIPSPVDEAAPVAMSDVELPAASEPGDGVPVVVAPGGGRQAESDDARGFGSISNRAACIAAFHESFPREARRTRQEGTVTIAARISADGRILSAEVVASNPRRVFDRAALNVLNSGVCKFDTATAAYAWQAEISYRLQGEAAD